MFLSHRQQRLQSWEQTRAKGKLRFIANMTIQWALPLAVGLPLMYFLLNISFLYMLLTFIFVLVVAPFAALVEWWKNEGAYTAAKLDRRMDSVNKG
jgi:fatty acid desaturase